jgi:hypothetical protein
VKPSERIQQLAKELHSKTIDPYFNGNVPDIGDWVAAIVEYLDGNVELTGCVHFSRPIPHIKECEP